MNDQTTSPIVPVENNNNNHANTTFLRNKLLIRRSERGYLVCILASRPGVPGSNPIATPKSLVMD